MTRGGATRGGADPRRSNPHPATGRGAALFASDGYERTTVRAVAAAADADPALVIRYFGSKEGLFAAATVFDLRLPSLAALPQGGSARRWSGIS